MPNKSRALNMAQAMGLNLDEFEAIEQSIGRQPNELEVRILSILWSDAVSKKNTIQWLKILPTEGDHILSNLAHNGDSLIDIGDNLLVALSMHSDNQNYQTDDRCIINGLSSNVRHILSQGAVPVAKLNFLRFGDLDLPQTQKLVRETINRTSEYGRVTGVPVIGGGLVFNKSFNQIPITNVMSVGIISRDDFERRTQLCAANSLVYLVGFLNKESQNISLHKTSNSYIAGVSFNDLYQEKLITEVLLDLNKACFIVGSQNIDRFGLMRAIANLLANTSSGIELEMSSLSKKPSEDILFSEDLKTAILIAILPQYKLQAEELFSKWELNFLNIGTLTSEMTVRIKNQTNELAVLPVSLLNIPSGIKGNTLQFLEPDSYQINLDFSIHSVKEPEELPAVAKFLLLNPNIASKQWLIEQFDTTIGGANMTTNFPTDAGLLNIKGTSKALSMSIDGNVRYMKADPEVGTQIAVAIAARNIVCSGSKPLAMTVCLNFGDPHNKNVAWEFVKAIQGLSSASQVFNVPIINSDINLYNQYEFDGKIVPNAPSPSIGMLGLLNNKRHHKTISFKSKGHMIYLLGHSVSDIASSIYLESWHKIDNSPAPYFDLYQEYELHKTVSQLINNGLVASVHDVSEGGLFISLFECSLENDLGFDITTDAEIRTDAFIFGEGQGRIVVSVSPAKETEFVDFMLTQHIPATTLGHVTRGELRIDDVSYGFIKEMKKDFLNALSQKFGS